MATKNQALMHIKRRHSQYLSSADTMSFWPEQETAVGVKLGEYGNFSIVAPFSLTSLFKGCITFNLKADEHTFWQRVEKKCWLTTWPKLVIKN